MNMLAILALAAQEEGGGGLFNLNLGVSFWTVVIFLALLALLSKYAFPAILGYANARERRIQEILDAAARDREQAERLVEEQRQALATARQEAQQVLAEAKQAAERVREDLLGKARAEQEELVARARQEMERERERAVETLRREAVELSLAAASKLVEQRLDAERDRELVREYLDRIGAEGGVGTA